MNREELHRQITQYAEKFHIMGVVRVTVRGEVVYQQSIGYADVEKQLPFTDESMFTLYSLSKSLCSTGLLKLKDRGLVDLDAHPAKHVPEAAGFDERVKIRHLLHHISGLPDFERNSEFAETHRPGSYENIRKHMKLLSRYPSHFAPGTDAMYANVNYITAALIIENVSGMPYAEYMKKEVFEPLGMKSAVIDFPGKEIPNRVKGYDWLDNKLVEVEKCSDWVLGAGDAVATVDDVYCLNKAIKNRLLLSEDTWKEALTPCGISTMGMGHNITDWHGKTRITHNGGHNGFRTLHTMIPEDDFDVILLSNTGFGNARANFAEFAYNAVYGEEDGKTDEIEMDKGYIHK